MRKLTATFFLLFLLQGVGQVVNGTLQVIVPHQNSKTVSEAASGHATMMLEGTDPTGMASTG